MKRLATTLLLSLFVSGCCALRQIAPSVTDNTRIEVCTETKFIQDLALVELPAIVKKVATTDTTSTLENTHAKSEATVTAGHPTAQPGDQAG